MLQLLLGFGNALIFYNYYRKPRSGFIEESCLQTTRIALYSAPEIWLYDDQEFRISKHLSVWAIHFATMTVRQTARQLEEWVQSDKQRRHERVAESRRVVTSPDDGGGEERSSI